MSRAWGLEPGVDGRTTYLGNFLQAVDAKGRVAIPSNLRSIMEKNSPDKVLVLSPHPSKPCLVGYDRGYADQRYREIKQRQAEDRVAGADLGDDDAAFDSFELAEELNFDASGRFVLPGFHRLEAQLEDLAFFRSRAQVFQIWNPRLVLEQEDVSDAVKKRLRYELNERGVVLS